MLPEAGYDLAYFVCFIGVLSMVYGAFAALAQKDFKRLVAYSSVSHMGYVVLGLGVWSAVAGNQFNADYWKMGMNGAMFQMIAHGISSPGMFFMVGVVYDRVHHRNLDQFGGLFAKMPAYSGLAMVIFFAGLGLPGLCGFIGEVFVTLSVWNFSRILAVICAFVVIITAGYILWTIQRVYLGAEYKGPHGDHLHEMTPREMAIAVPIVVLCIVLGVYPRVALDYVTPSVDRTVDSLARWTARNAPETSAPAAEQAAQLPELTPVVARQ
jgi:NADH-quinone oxidoreductase subunit M